ncbi:MAG TPA: rhodanese-like domain-containing protein [Gemmatimonadales bacterium]|nr:rhodanese-like domain-containing protein [Gemmatimonadales bacterium]
MIFQRFFDDKLAQASYLVGCIATGEAVVVDANRDVEPYVRAAEREGLRIVAVTETHIHADYLSGSRELAARTGAKLHLSDCGPAEWKYGFAKSDNARLLKEGDEIVVGNVKLRVLHTPGHTPEHLSFLVIDGAATTEPMSIITGDFVFCGDVGRPDLLEKAVQVKGSAEVAAKVMWKSLEKFRALPDHLTVWPGHGAGSACGKGMSSVPCSSVGYEKAVNWAFQAKSEKAFVDGVLAGQPEPPAYFATMKRLNRDGPRVIGAIKQPPLLDFARLAKAKPLVDLRSGADFASGHIPGSLSIPLNKSFTTWAGSLLPYDQDLVLLFPDRDAAGLKEAVRDLALIGLDRIAGYWTVDAIDWWKDQGRPFQTVNTMTATEVASLPAKAGQNRVIVDVRARSEWDAGHLKGAIHIPLPELADRMKELPTDQPLVLHCQGGGRSMIAASLLQAHGVTDVTNLTGGYGAWVKAGLPTED